MKRDEAHPYSATDVFGPVSYPTHDLISQLPTCHEINRKSCTVTPPAAPASSTNTSPSSSKSPCKTPGGHGGPPHWPSPPKWTYKPKPTPPSHTIPGKKPCKKPGQGGQGDNGNHNGWGNNDGGHGWGNGGNKGGYGGHW
jgi:hypothetical protein